MISGPSVDVEWRHWFPFQMKVSAVRSDNHLGISSFVFSNTGKGYKGLKCNSFSFPSIVCFLYEKSLSFLFYLLFIYKILLFFRWKYFHQLLELKRDWENILFNVNVMGAAFRVDIYIDTWISTNINLKGFSVLLKTKKISWRN